MHVLVILQRRVADHIHLCIVESGRNDRYFDIRSERIVLTRTPDDIGIVAGTFLDVFGDHVGLFQGDLFVTRGDVDQDIYYVSSNEKQMSDTNKVFQDQVLGACVFVVPGLGNILLFLSSWMGLSTLFFIVLLLGGGYFVVRYLKHNFRGGESSEEE